MHVLLLHRYRCAFCQPVKHVICAGKGTQHQAHHPIMNTQLLSTVNPGYCTMEIASIAQLMLPYFLKISNKRWRALMLIAWKEHLQGHYLLLKGDRPLIVTEWLTWMLVLIQFAIRWKLASMRMIPWQMVETPLLPYLHRYLIPLFKVLDVFM